MFSSPQEKGSEDLAENPSWGMIARGSMLPEGLEKSWFFLLLDKK
jgi:hypothetical protein